ncbi:YqiA/YcfP family alpha/beta fold hydrolase [Spartinivicinus poritis]|uniref:Esterase n=1 Tax=Spartinivicinus poritis TaxID=2994640 RepID=A0ABT5U6B0_9GAMM|nr:YqiA/YcfP family alpha/beta fold hydrolase [Spartinivicinus sp. A2-2]MDE1461913.1 esterase [Spartinivicinus sp. A2-2]
MINESALARPLIVYIHGFCCSPASTKARLLVESLKTQPFLHQVWVPTLPFGPEQAIDLLWPRLQQESQQKPVYLIGSSLGGYYGTWLYQQLSQQYQKSKSVYEAKLVLINPAVRPYEMMADYLGEHNNYYTGEQYILTQEHVNQLKALQVSAITNPDNCLLLVQTGDETLDYRKAVDYYQASPTQIIPGGNHGFEGFAEYLPQIYKFFGLL